MQTVITLRLKWKLKQQKLVISQPEDKWIFYIVPQIPSVYVWMCVFLY